MWIVCGKQIKKSPYYRNIITCLLFLKGTYSISGWRRTISHGNRLLKCRLGVPPFIPTFFSLLQVWRFSTAFSPVLSWHFTDLPSMSNHLKKCHFNTVEHKTEPVPLPAMCTARDGHSLRGVLRHINTWPNKAIQEALCYHVDVQSTLCLGIITLHLLHQMWRSLKKNTSLVTVNFCHCWWSVWWKY